MVVGTQCRSERGISVAGIGYGGEWKGNWWLAGECGIVCAQRRGVDMMCAWRCCLLSLWCQGVTERINRRIVADFIEI